MRNLRLIGELDHNFGWLGGRLTNGALCDPDTPAPRELLGAFADIGCNNGTAIRLVRDPLGVNKLFWSRVGQEILLAARPWRLVNAGCPFESIQSIPAGSVVDLDMARGRSTVSPLNSGASSPEGDLSDIARQMRTRLDRCMDELVGRFRGARAFVCLSGGLDSAAIAALVSDHFPDTTAVSFDISRSNGYRSEDRRAAERLARDLALPLLYATAAADEILNHVDTVLREGIDWRDFNVHAALVNACLARTIAAEASNHPPSPVLVFTGDLMNEFLVDYHSETYDGRQYYRLPRLHPALLRSTLVRGLETSHREIGPFEWWGLPVVQPYVAVTDLLMSLPAWFLAEPLRKDRLMTLVCGDRLPSYVFGRTKTRAQVGDGDIGSGVLGLCVDRGMDSHWLRRRFAELHGVRDVSVLACFIRAGRYRSGIPLPEEHAA